MSVARRKGPAGKADLLFSRLVRSRGVCERCGNRSGPFDTAHIIGRRYSATRCDERNAWCLCRSCHQLVDSWADEKMSMVRRTIGEEVFADLKQQANSHAISAGVFWPAEAERLLQRCVELGISTRR